MSAENHPDPSLHGFSSPPNAHLLIRVLRRFTEEDTAVDYFGQQLLAAGYNYYGNEPMYSGITGEEFAADIYLGVVYYQRLRHMVLDKFQVRTTGPVDPVTRQPVKVSSTSFSYTPPSDCVSCVRTTSLSRRSILPVTLSLERLR